MARYTESKVRGERRPVVDYNRSVATPTNPAFVTSRDYRDPRNVRTNFSGTYSGLDIDNEVFGPSGIVDRKSNQAERRVAADRYAQGEYNKSYGPGGTSSRPKYPTNARDTVREGAKFLKSALEKRKTKREGGMPKGKGR